MTDTTDREIMQQALDAMMDAMRVSGGISDKMFESVNALSERLAQPDPRNQCGETCERAKLCAVCLAEMGAQPEQKPVVWLSTDSIGEMYLPTPPQKREWQGLTDKEVGALTVFDGLHHVEIPILANFVWAVEAKLKEKNK